MTLYEETPTVRDANSHASAALSASANEASTPNTNNLSVSAQEVVVSSPVSVTPAVNPELAVASEPSSTQEDTANLTSDDTTLLAPQEIAASVIVSDTPPPTATPTAVTSPMYKMKLSVYACLFLSSVIIMITFDAASGECRICLLRRLHLP